MAANQLECLEDRHLLSANLAIAGYAGAAREQAQAFLPAGNASLSIGAKNLGDTLIDRDFYIQYRLVPIPAGSDGSNADFYHAGAIDIGQVLVTDNVAPGGAIPTPVVHQLQYPQNLPPGWYACMLFLDSTGAVTESNESDNYFVRSFGRAIRADGVAVLEGTESADSISVSAIANSPDVRITVNGVDDLYPGGVGAFEIRGHGGDDLIVANYPILIPLHVDGGGGNDRIVGGEAGDFLIGGSGKDQIDGGAGNDRLNGNGGNDKLFGNAGADRIYGYAGNDYLDGGSSADRLDGGSGLDILLGQSGNDRLFTKDTEPDQLFGASGLDSAERDDIDLLSSIELRS